MVLNHLFGLMQGPQTPLRRIAFIQHLLCATQFHHSVFTDAIASVDHPWTPGLCLRNGEQHVSSWPGSWVRGDQQPLPLLPAELLVLQLLNRLGGGGEAIYRYSFILAGSRGLQGWHPSIPSGQGFPGPWC